MSHPLLLSLLFRPELVCCVYFPKKALRTGMNLSLLYNWAWTKITVKTALCSSRSMRSKALGKATGEHSTIISKKSRHLTDKKRH